MAAIRPEYEPTRLEDAVGVMRGCEPIGTITPGTNRYFRQAADVERVAVATDWLRAKRTSYPLINLTWLAGLVFVGGSLIAMWGPMDASSRRLELRFAGDEAPLSGT
jgi:hypothetical protein